MLKHIGRKSGREYHTPVTAFPLGNGFVLALLYGDASEVDWCLNVMAAGKCILKTRGEEFVLERPESISTSQAMPAFPPLFRFVYRLQKVHQFLWVHLP
ncbi:MAG: nitroreductase family deazaflavin-dependent oxidoreductase [Anaerolineae bacterium]|nr:nitroreductase family deazaflavin-dependent oxidoreductase [Anaerolineae bacterium]